jgi:hypothetical protein
MFKLRKQHLDAFEAQIVQSFAARAVAHVKAVWPAECQELGEAPLAEMVANSIKRGAALGLSGELDMVRFIDLGFILAKDFETNPLVGWVRPILADRTLTPGAMIDRVYQQMEEQFALIEKRKGAKV